MLNKTFVHIPAVILMKFTKNSQSKIYFLPFSEALCYNYFAVKTASKARRRNILWQIVLGTAVSEDGKQVTTYGLRCNSTVIGDITLSEQEITEFAEQLNRLGASEIHAYELVENFLGK